MQNNYLSKKLSNIIEFDRVEVGYNIDNYIELIKYPDPVHIGLNNIYIKIKQPQLFANNSNIYIEAVDSNNNVIYSEVDITLDDTLKKYLYIKLYVYDNNIYNEHQELIYPITSNGICKLMICGVLTDSNIINYKHTEYLLVDNNKRNADDIIFKNVPIVDVVGSVKPYTNKTYADNVRTETLKTGNISYKYNIYTNTAYISSDTQIFTNYTTDNNTAYIKLNKIIQTDIINKPDSYILQNLDNLKFYNEIEILDAYTAVIKNNNYIKIDTLKRKSQYIIDECIFRLDETDNFLTYQKLVTSTSTDNNRKYNYIICNFSNLETISGLINSIKTYYRSNGINDYILCNESKISKSENNNGIGLNEYEVKFNTPVINFGGTDNFDFKFEFINPIGYESTHILYKQDISLNDANNGIIISDTLIPKILISPALLNFGEVDNGTTSQYLFFTTSGSNLTNNITLTAPTGYTISTAPGGTYASTLTLTQTAGTVANTTIYVKFSPTACKLYIDNITLNSDTATENILVVGNCVKSIDPFFIITPEYFDFGEIIGAESATSSYHIIGQNIPTGSTIDMQIFNIANVDTYNIATVVNNQQQPFPIPIQVNATTYTINPIVDDMIDYTIYFKFLPEKGNADGGQSMITHTLSPNIENIIIPIVYITGTDII